MVRGIGKVKKEKRMTAIEKDIERTKDISAAYLQGGKAVGEMIKPKNKKGKK